MSKVLVCDINIKNQGHYIGFNQYILDNFLGIEKTNPAIHFSFLYNKEAQQLMHIDQSVKERFFFIDGVQKNSTINRYRMLLKIKKIALAHNIDHLVFMDLDQYQLPFFLIKFPFSLSGILFRPHHRIMPANNTLAVKTATRLRRLKKKAAEKLIVNKKAFKNIFILNDAEGVSDLNRIHNSSSFTYLPDPVFNYLDKKDFTGMDKKAPHVYQYLIFGSINERKNITNIITAYSKASIPFGSELLITGPAKNEYVDYLNNLISGLGLLTDNQKKVIIKNDFVSNAEMDLAFQNADVCLLIYKDFFGSSGIMGRAALHHLKIIGPATGLLQQLINTYHLGITTDPTDINAIAKSMENITSFQISTAGMDDFYNTHSPEKFLQSLTNPLSL